MKSNPDWFKAALAVAIALAVVAYLAWSGPGTFDSETLRLMQMKPQAN